MESEDLLDFLRSTTLLGDVPAEAVNAIAASMRPLELASGAVLFEKGDPGESAYVILEGELALVSDGIELLRRGRGGIVGEFSLIDGMPRSTAAVASGSVRLLSWERAAFHEVLAADPGVARAVLRALTAKLRTDVERGTGLLVERHRWNEDIARSREIQAAMLPEEELCADGLAVVGRCTPAGALGGDFYDVLPLDRGRSAVVMADVTGHGFHSGLIVAMVKACLHTQARVDTAPRAMLQALRRTLSLSMDPGMLMSCVYCVFEPEAGRMRYANAGHPHPLLQRQGGPAVALDVLDPILGAQEPGENCFEEREIPWRAGDRLVLYSDGVTEARSPSDEMFGRSRLETMLAEVGPAQGRATRDAMLEAVAHHSAGAALQDDLTLVVLDASCPQAS